MSVLIVQLPLTTPGAATGYRYVQTRDGQSVEQQGTAHATLLPSAGLANDVLALVPALALSWHLVDLPKGALASGPLRLRAVLEGLLEDRLLDDAAQLHLALSPHAAAGKPVWVAACDKAWLRAALAPLEAAGRPVSRIVPELVPAEVATAMDADTGTGTQLLALSEGEGDTGGWLARTSAQGVLVLPLGAAAAQALASLNTKASAQAGAPDSEPASEAFSLVAEPAVLARAEQLLGRTPELEQAAGRWLRASRNGWDLAQFDLANSTRQRTFKKLGDRWRQLLYAPQWRAARVGLVVLVLAQVLGLNAWAWKEQSLLAAKRAQVKLLLTQTFPQVKLVVDAPLQMARELALLRQGAGASSGQDLEQMLSSLGQGLQPGPAAALAGLRGIDFADGELRLKGLPPDFGASLGASGYNQRLDGDSLVLQVAVKP